MFIHLISIVVGVAGVAADGGAAKRKCLTRNRYGNDQYVLLKRRIFVARLATHAITGMR